MTIEQINQFCKSSALNPNPRNVTWPLLTGGTAFYLCFVLDLLCSSNTSIIYFAPATLLNSSFLQTHLADVCAPSARLVPWSIMSKNTLLHARSFTLLQPPCWTLPYFSKLVSPTSTFNQQGYSMEQQCTSPTLAFPIHNMTFVNKRLLSRSPKSSNSYHHVSTVQTPHACRV